MKQEYHYTISRTDRICLIGFVAFLLGWELVKYLLPSDDILIGTDPVNVLAQDSLNSMSDGIQSEKTRMKLNKTPAEETFDPLIDDEETGHMLKPVPIMEASWDDLKQIGFSGKVASNITKYVSAGGQIKNEKDLLKIYGMDSVTLARVRAYLLFPSAKAYGDLTDINPVNTRAVSPAQVFDLNHASASELESLPGIGAVLADRIIKFRDALGGFIRIDQLTECYGLLPETVEKIKPLLTISDPPATIAINKINYNTFSHPYLSKKMVSIIKAYKEHHGAFTNVSDLRKVFPPDSAWCDKILPYLSFE